MHYVSAEGLSKSYGVVPLFNNISFHINEGDKIALIARNGVGKSTLLKILNGNETPDEGKLFINKDVTVALFEQEPMFDESKTVLENIFHINHPVLNVIREYELASDNEDGEKLAELFIKMDELNAWNFEVKVKQILNKLNIHHLQHTVSSLSGGQRKRVALAKTLIDIGFEHKHTLLMMDEPTNHLDVEMIEWLENYLNQENITLLLVTHDRYFLDAVTEEIWELERSNMYVYKGDYENYIEKKAARIESEQASIDKAKNEYRKELEWMRKQPKARTTKSKARQDNFYTIETKAKQKIEDAQIQLQVKMSRLGGKIIEMKKVCKSYGEHIILKGFDYTFSKGERIGIIGKNGVGKSTFLNILQHIEPADSGKINIGDTVIFGNFSQQGLVIKENIRVIEYVKTFAENFPLANGGSLSAAQFLELFLFTPEKQYTYLSALSGGEKKRLQLLTILFRNPNFLILDEPTNDLDLPTLTVLENFLSEYQGCVLIVSHDRYFMDRLVDHLFIFEGSGIVTDFPGNYTQYRLQEKEDDRKKITDSNKTEVNNTVTNTASTIPAKKISFKEKREFELLEKEIPTLEAEKQQIEQQLSNTEINYEQITLLSKRIAEVNSQLELKEMRWLELSELM
ncbi:MAG: ABC-F family ATP-binding cassette domain-containing protein [Bacteroidetes bacterium]|nr:ABC-F family ATP-binding cassette domain-containing protein [Bacteroidota bacterium]